jgi:hypothetical protein
MFAGKIFEELLDYFDTGINGISLEKVDFEKIELPIKILDEIKNDLLEKTSEIGIWPNDALLCRQFFPWLQHYYPYFTKVQGSASTTTK